ncbi:MAG TPA: hypothetical protein DCE41_29485 [Cytophagales bacterium]|nr:hypothetical protein [Cytophagales bacterium]HAA18563.1 hypothetical protein [Cytophagales bacterium]HAP60208.1 hypothetical protein [Cytophagales bacterium]
MENVKSFTFKVAKATESTEEVKVREGVAVAGCSRAQIPGTPIWDFRYRGTGGNTWPYNTDDGWWC